MFGRNSVFDSKSEKILFKRLKTYWSKYVDVFPQIPVKTIIGYEEILKYSKNPKERDYLLKTSFDFAICELETGIPLLLVEFDGLSGGFSQDGNFYMKSIPKNDKHRKLKMDAKLKLCSEYRVPMIVISYDESNVLRESGDLLSILDVIIGDAMEKRHHETNFSKYMDMLTEAYEFGGREAAECTTIEIDMLNEQHNPIKRKIREITNKFPIWPMQLIYPEEEDNWLTGKFCLTCGSRTINGGVFETMKLLVVNLRIRKVGVFDSDSLFLFNTIGEYCLARKTQHELGTDRDSWEQAMEKAQWTAH